MDKKISEVEHILARYGSSFAPTEKQYGIFMEEAVDLILDWHIKLLAKEKMELVEEIKKGIKQMAYHFPPYENSIDEQMNEKEILDYLEALKLRIQNLLKELHASKIRVLKPGYGENEEK